MDLDNISKEELVQLITKIVVETLKIEPSIPIGVSNRHIHLSRRDMDVLFGAGSELTHMKQLKQPGQYAAEETVILKGPKGEIGKVRVLGPMRADTQIEISVTDGFTLGIKPPIRESGSIDGTPGIEIIGPKGSVTASVGVIGALRHIHMTPEDAKRFGVKDKDWVSAELGSNIRRGIIRNVLVRVSDKYALEMHVDVDEANALGVKNGDLAVII